MRKANVILVSAAAAFLSFSGCAKKNAPVSSASEKVIPAEDQVFTFVEQMPSFPGGESALLDFLVKEIKYPIEARNNNEEGRVMMRFIVRSNGSITDAQVVRGVSESIDKEALRVVKEMPKWIPGKQNGRPVSVHYTLPITFTFN